MRFNPRQARLMPNLIMPIAVLLLFMPPCMIWYAPGLMSGVYLLQKGIFLVCVYYFVRYRLFNNSYFWLLLIYLMWIIAVTIVSGNSLAEWGSYLNIFSVCVITMYCMSRSPQKYTGYVAFIFVLWMLLNTLFWKEGGMYLNSNGQMSFVLGTKTSLTYYQIVACCFIGLYGQFIDNKNKYRITVLHVILLFSVVLWNLRQPISTSELCIAIYFVLLVLNHIEHPFVDKIFRFGFAATIVLNIGIVFFNAQMFFANFITSVLHESADLNYRTTIWKVVLTKIADNPILGHGLNTGTHFSFDSGTSSINQATHNFLLYLIFVGGIIGTVYFLFICMLGIRRATKKDRMIGRTLDITLICFGLMWITEQLKSFDMIFLCLLACVCAGETKQALVDLDEGGKVAR